MKDLKWDKIVLDNRIWQESGWSKRISGSNLETDNAENLDMTESMIYKNKSTKFVTEIEFLAQNSGQDPSHGRILCLHVRYSNGNILSFWYRNQAIQKPKFIYAYRTTILMKELKWDKIVLENRIWQ
jgi:hypothetical protein